jgi:hypothetical protein
MKRNAIINSILSLAIVLLLMFTLCSCEKTENALLSEFKAMTEEEPTYKNLGKAASFIDSNIANLSEEAGSRLILAYEDFLLRFLNNNEVEEHQFFGEELFIYTEYTEDSALKVVDYESIINKYAAQISSELIELLSIKTSETKEPAVIDATLQLTYEGLLQRALRTENLLAEHSNEDVLKASALEYYKNYLFLLLAGSDSSPVFDYDTGAFSPVAREAYENFIIEHPETVLANILTEYFAYLNNIKYTIDYMNATENKVFYDTCDYLINEAAQSF